MRLLVEDEITRYYLFARVRRHRVYAGKVGDERVGVTLDSSVLAVDGDSGEVADVLLRAREAVEQRSLAAVLVADESERHDRTRGQGSAAALLVELAALTETGVLGALLFGFF